MRWGFKDEAAGVHHATRRDRRLAVGGAGTADCNAGDRHPPLWLRGQRSVRDQRVSFWSGGTRIFGRRELFECSTVSPTGGRSASLLSQSSYCLSVRGSSSQQALLQSTKCPGVSITMANLAQFDKLKRRDVMTLLGAVAACCPRTAGKQGLADRVYWWCFARNRVRSRPRIAAGYAGAWLHRGKGFHHRVVLRGWNL